MNFVVKHMNSSFENETWIIDAGDQVIQKMAGNSDAVLSSKERLIYCLWVADYCMRNAGDISQASVMHAGWQKEAAEHSKKLVLDFCGETFLLPESSFEEQYFSRFDGGCPKFCVY